MKLDHTLIAIRERGLPEICDLSLHVVRDRLATLLWLLLIGAIPWILIDWLLVRWTLESGYASDYGFLYYWIMTLLVISQAQIGTALITNFLGQAMFVGKPGVWQTVKSTLLTNPYFWWSHAGVRLVVPILFVVFLSIEADEGTVMGINVFLLPGLVFLAMLIRSFRPFASEMLLLEKTPIFKKNKEQTFFKERSKSLHNAASTILFGRACAVALLLSPLTFTFFALFVSSDKALNMQANSETSLFAYYWIAALWLTAGFAAVIRFLSYVDIRIRQEGWAVELKIRAQGALVRKAFE